MGFDIPMNTKGAMDLSSMVSGGLDSIGSTSMQSNAVDMNSMNNMSMQQNYNQQNNMNMQPNNMGMQQNYNQQPQQDYNYNQQSYNQQQPQQSYNQQPQQNYNTQPQQNYNQQPQQNYNQQPMQQQSTQKQRPQGGGVKLKKGQKVALGAPGQTLQSVQVCLGWDVTDGRCDLDASAFMLGNDNRVVGDDWFVFYGQTASPDGSVTHSGDSLGASAGDDEIITVNLPQVNPQVQKIAFVVTINEALEKGLNFSMVSNAYVRVVDKSNGQELNRFMLTDYYSNVTSMVVGEIYRYNGAWKFNAVGDGVAKDLAGLCGMYGVNVAD